MDLRLLDSLERVVTAAAGSRVASALAGSASKVRQEIIHGRRVRPWVYATHWMLVQGIRQRRPITVEKAISSMVPGVAWTASRLSIGGLPLSDDRDVRRRNIANLFLAEHRATYSLQPKLVRLNANDLKTPRATARQVLEQIRCIDRATYEEMVGLVAEIGVMASDSLNAGSSFPLFGLIYLNTLRPSESAIHYLEHFVHETAHHLLFAIGTIDPILTPNACLFKSPLRNEPRPLSAVFHQMFVLSRVIRIWSIFQRTDAFGDEIFKPFTSYQNDHDGTNFVEKFEIAAETISKHAELTPVGRRLFAAANEMVERNPVRFHR